MTCDYCIDNLNVNVTVSEIRSKCKYHKTRGAVYPAESCAPKGMCRELMHAAYPACLALLYAGTPRRFRLRSPGIRELVVSCPHPDGVTLRIRAKERFPAPLRALKELLEEFLKLFNKPKDAPFRRVFLEVVKAGPACPKSYPPGRRFEFNINSARELCPAGFAAIYPLLRQMKEQGPGSIKVMCPDYKGVVYEVSILP